METKKQYIQAKKDIESVKKKLKKKLDSGNPIPKDFGDKEVEALRKKYNYKWNNWEESHGLILDLELWISMNCPPEHLLV